MRLYLSSFRLGDHPERLVQLAGAGRQALAIANACDGFPAEERPGRVERELAALRGLGFAAEELDLRDYFGGRGREVLAERLSRAGLVWVRGGNAFVLLRAMRQSGFDGMITELLRKDALVYGGYSGGIAVLAPSLRGIELVNDANTVPEGYGPEVPWEGLGLVPYAIAPHYRSPHPSSPGIDAVVDYFTRNGVPFKALRDGEVILMSPQASTPPKD